MNAEEIRQLADDILARPEFRQPEPSLIEQARDWVEKRIGDILDAAFSGSAGSLVGWVVLLVAVGLIIWSATRFSRTVQAGGRVGIQVEGIHRRSPGQWRAEAEAHEAAGAWKEALRCRYRALIGDLVAEGVLDDVAGRTTGEFRRDVTERAPDRSEAFSAATELFELAWYADRPTGADESARFQALAATVVGVRA
ncbi:MAG TPA: DUF4129 domain-containing protein [Acidimicrobiales bacterium]